MHESFGHNPDNYIVSTTAAAGVPFSFSRSFNAATASATTSDIFFQKEQIN
jgi:hypothetical protein